MLDDLVRLGNLLDNLTRENVAELWMQREVLATKVLAPIPMAAIRDASVPARNRQIPVRIYQPTDRSLAWEDRLPVLVYYHGGGWTLGSLAITTAFPGRCAGHGSGGRVGGLSTGAFDTRTRRP